MNFLLAMDWLLTHESDPDIDTPLSDEEEGREELAEEYPEESREVDSFSLKHFFIM